VFLIYSFVAVSGILKNEEIQELVVGIGSYVHGIWIQERMSLVSTEQVCCFLM